MVSFNQKILSILEKLPRSLSFCLFMISFVSGFRFLGEWLILDGQNYINFGAIPHYVAFYIAMFMIHVNNMSLLLGKKRNDLYGIVGLGVLLGILPVIIDASIIDIAIERYHYFEEFNLFLSSQNQPVGETISLWTLIVCFSLYVFIASSSWIKTLLALILSYCTVQLFGWGSYICKEYFFNLTLLKTQTDHFWAIWFILIAFAFGVAGNWPQFKSVFQRIYHTFIWGVLVLLGAKLIGFIDSETLLRAFVMSLSFLFVMLVNDYYDKDSDRINNRESAITWDMVLFIIYLHIILVLTAGSMDLVFGVIVFLCFVLGLAYSVPNILRLKRNFVLGSLVEGTGAALCLLAGGTQFGPPLNQYFLLLVVLVGIGFMIASNMKDYKDFRGDSESGVLTLYVCLYKRGWQLTKINYFISIILGATLLISCGVLYLLHVRTSMILVACVMSIIPSVLLIKLPAPAAAVKYTLLAVTIYFSVPGQSHTQIAVIDSFEELL